MLTLKVSNGRPITNYDVVSRCKAKPGEMTITDPSTTTARNPLARVGRTAAPWNSRSSFGCDIRGLDDLRPLARLAGDERTELGASASAQLQSSGLGFATDICVGHCSIDLSV